MLIFVLLAVSHAASHQKFASVLKVLFSLASLDCATWSDISSLLQRCVMQHCLTEILNDSSSYIIDELAVTKLYDESTLCQWLGRNNGGEVSGSPTKREPMSYPSTPRPRETVTKRHRKQANLEVGDPFSFPFLVPTEDVAENLQTGCHAVPRGHQHAMFACHCNRWCCVIFERS